MGKTSGNFVKNSNDWKLLGNLGTNDAVNFVGTLDNQDLVFRTDNTERLRITNDPSGSRYLLSNTIGNRSTYIGELVGNPNDNSLGNVILGWGNLRNAGTSYNYFNYGVGFGLFSGITTGSRNVVMGSYAGGDGNYSAVVAIGNEALRYNKTNSNIAIGSFAGRQNNLGTLNIFIGNNAGENANGTQGTLVIGGGAFKNNVGGAVSNFNNIYGHGAFANHLSGFRNDVSGYNTFGQLTQGSNLVSVGWNSGTNCLDITSPVPLSIPLDTANGCIYIGSNVAAGDLGIEGEIVISSNSAGNVYYGAGSNTTTLGHSSTEHTIVPAGTLGVNLGDRVLPTSPLQVGGIPSFDDDVAAGIGGLTTGAFYQTSSTNTFGLPAGVLMIKQ